MQKSILPVDAMEKILSQFCVDLKVKFGRFTKMAILMTGKGRKEMMSGCITKFNS
jgi:hypothetical protein